MYMSCGAARAAPPWAVRKARFMMNGNGGWMDGWSGGGMWGGGIVGVLLVLLVVVLVARGMGRKS